MRGETRADTSRKGLQPSHDRTDTPLPRVLNRATGIRRESGSEDNAGVHQIQIVDDAF